MDSEVTSITGGCEANHGVPGCTLRSYGVRGVLWPKISGMFSKYSSSS